MFAEGAFREIMKEFAQRLLHKKNLGEIPEETLREFPGWILREISQRTSR